MSALADFCAYWFAAKRLGLEVEKAPAANASLDPELDRVALAAALADAAEDAAMRVWPHVVRIDLAILERRCVTAARVFEVRDALLASSGLTESAKGKDVALGFADYIASRWIWRLVLKTEIRRRPLRAPFPPNYDARRKHELVDALERLFLRLEIPIDVAEVRKGVDKWKDLGDVRTAVVAHAK